MTDRPLPPSFPWIAIPSAAHPAQPHAFVSRQRQLEHLYRGLVAAGNVVCEGQAPLHSRYVISGPVGVGKSCLILQALGILRGELGIAEGQLPFHLPEPQHRHRWLVLRVSGKHNTGIDALADAIKTAVFSALDDVREQAEPKPLGALELPLVSRLFRETEEQLFKEVRSLLITLAATIEYVRVWQGCSVNLKLEGASQGESSKGVEVDLQLELRRLGKEPTTVETKAALKLAAGFVRKWVTSIRTSITLDRKLVINTDLVVDALNNFFVAAERATVPTLLVLDDFDELASDAGPSTKERSKVVSSTLSAFSRLTPSCFLVGLRSEYMQEDITRQYRSIYVPALTRSAALEALELWARVQQPPLSNEGKDSLMRLGQRLTERLVEQPPMVIPLRFLQLAEWIINNLPQWWERSTQELLMSWLVSVLPPEIEHVVCRVAQAMPKDHVRLCAGSIPLAPEPYAMSEGETHALVQWGLLRAANAADPTDNRIVLDPVCAYLHLAD